MHRSSPPLGAPRAAARRATLVALLSAAVSTCGDATGPGGPGGLFIVSGSQVTDTVLTRLEEPLVVEVRDDDGRRLSGVVVRFDAVRIQRPGSWYTESVVTFRDVPASPTQTMAFDTTDADGRASVPISFGFIADEGIVTINAPALGFDARATYTVLPGAAVDVRAVPADTALYVAGSYAMRGTTVDRWGNARRDDPVAYESPAEHIELTDGSVSGASIGRDRIVVVHGEWRDTAWVSVVPRGRLAALKARASTADTAALVEFELDGSDYRQVTLPYWAEPRPDWMPNGTLVHEDAGEFAANGNHIVVRDAIDGPARRLVTSETGLQQEFHPQVTADGSWVYFAGGFPNRQGHTEIWRVRSDGTGAERVGEPSGYYEGDTQPAPSPDGGRVAYATDRHGCCYSFTLRMLEVATGAIDTLRESSGAPVVGTMPRWSPDGDVVAYLAQSPEHGNTNANRIWLMNADGGERRVISDPDIAYRGPYDWSPDGEWLVAPSFDDGRLHVIQRATGLSLPLAFTSRIVQPAWRP